MGTTSFYLDEEIDELKLKEIAKKQDRSVSNLVSHLLKQNFDVLKKGKKK